MIARLDPFEPPVPNKRAAYLLLQAQQELADDEDPMGTIQLALAVLRAQAGELPKDEVVEVMSTYPLAEELSAWREPEAWIGGLDLPEPIYLLEAPAQPRRV